ncbi:MAG TPA: FeoB-associated Cys-rich membrane protein [Pyrinomonadaceae bacterium]
MFDWQTIAVALIILGALVYVARRGIRRLRSFGTQAGAPPCATGCGSCGGEPATKTKAAPLLVQISTRRTSSDERSP